MKRYQVIITEEAQQDLRDLSNTIVLEYKSPLTAISYLRGIYAEFNTLQTHAESFKIQKQQSLLNFGRNIRRINYKKMAILYLVVSDKVYIKRVIPSSTIKELEY